MPGQLTREPEKDSLIFSEPNERFLIFGGVCFLLCGNSLDTTGLE
jgi:hypothetical protein